MAEKILGADGRELAELPVTPGDPDRRADAPEPLPERDSDAPYGRKADGTPRQPPGPKPRRERSAQSRAEPVTAEPVTDSRRAVWQAGLAGYAQMTAGLAVVAYNRSQNDAYLADAAAITLHSPALSGALVAVAEQDPKVARVLDRICAVGPYGALVTAVVGLGAQLAANHGRLADGALGTVPKEQLLAAHEGPAEDDAVPNSG